MKPYRLLSGDTIRLDVLGASALAFLKNLQRMAKDKVSFFEIERVAIGPGSPALKGWSRVTREIVSSPLYRVAEDISERAGIAEGLILAPEHEAKRKDIPIDRTQMSVTQAAATLGISRAAVHKAIGQKRLAAQRYGNAVLVGREEVARFKQARANGDGRPVRSRVRGSGGGSAKAAMAAKAR
jgi:excisionase family DNA binding protein